MWARGLSPHAVTWTLLCERLTPSSRSGVLRCWNLPRCYDIVTLYTFFHRELRYFLLGPAAFDVSARNAVRSLLKKLCNARDCRLKSRWQRLRWHQRRRRPSWTGRTPTTTTTTTGCRRHWVRAWLQRQSPAVRQSTTPATALASSSTLKTTMVSCVSDLLPRPVANEGKTYSAPPPDSVAVLTFSKTAIIGTTCCKNVCTL